MRGCINHFLFGLLVLLLTSAITAQADFNAAKHAYDQAEYATALKDLTPLAEQGNADAQALLGTMYFKGQGVPKDFRLALKWYQAAADQGNPQGQFQIGAAYLNGIGVAKDGAQALKWLRLSADQGNSDAQLFLGLAYRNLHDVPNDFVQAYMWLHLAALAGDPLAPRQRDDLQRVMTPDQIAKARAMAAAWKPANSRKQAEKGNN